VSKSTRFSQALAKSPLMWGILACGGFYGLIWIGVLQSQFVQRYFASHPVEYITTAMFFVGLAALAIKVVDIVIQYQRVNEPLLGPIPRGGQLVTDCDSLLARLKRLPEQAQDHYLVRRLRDAVEYVRRSGSAEGLDEERRYLADTDAGRLHVGYSLVRVIIWAIPILGFLGTVIGITLAIAKLAPEALESSLPQVTAGLGVAFDTTALALALSIVLMFAQFLAERLENALLTQVDQRAEAELVGRFERISSGPDGQLVAVRRMVEAVLGTTEQLVGRQADLWQASLDDAQKRWTRMADTAGATLQTALAGALQQSLKTHAQELVAAEQVPAERNRRNWERVQHAMVQNTETVAALQKAVIQKAEVLHRAVQGTEQVTKLQEALNNNLVTLAGSKNFEQTVMSLAAAIHLLNSRLGNLPSDAPLVQLESKKRTGHAA